eukprot:scaffold33271_cov62-Phaeocystis_antarctica.AAC.2
MKPFFTAGHEKTCRHELGYVAKGEVSDHPTIELYVPSRSLTTGKAQALLLPAHIVGARGLPPAPSRCCLQVWQGGGLAVDRGRHERVRLSLDGAGSAPARTAA